MKNLLRITISAIIISTSFLTSAYAETNVNSIVADVTPEYNCKAIITDEGMTDNLSYSFKTGSLDMQPSDALLMLNGQFIPYKGIIQNGTTFVPVRVISESFGAEVKWYGKLNQVSISNSSTKIIMNIGKEKAVINGEEKTLDFAPFIKNELTYVPLRFVSETLGKSVGYVPAFQEKDYPNTKLLAYNPVVWVDEYAILNDEAQKQGTILSWLKDQLNKDTDLLIQRGNEEAFTKESIESTAYIGQVGRYALFQSTYPILVDMSSNSIYFVNLIHARGTIYKVDSLSAQLVEDKKVATKNPYHTGYNNQEVEAFSKNVK